MADAPVQWLLGVDSGGTASRARLSDMSGAVLGEGRAGPGNAYTDPEGGLRNIRHAISAAFADAGIDDAERVRTRACLGIAGLDPGEPRLPPGWTFGDFAAQRIETDASIALCGAHGGQDGAILIIGTGVVGLALKDGVRLSVGGYGPSLSDEGGGAWIGQEAVRRTLWSIDGRIAASDLTREIGDRLGPPVAVLDWAQRACAADYGAFAPLVLRAAEALDVNAAQILDDAVAFIDRIIDRLADIGVDRISLLGGLSSRLAPRLNLAGIALVAPEGDALAGALLLAQRP